MSVVKLPFYAKLALILLATVLILFLLIEGRSIFIPLVLALLFAILLLPLNNFLQYKLQFGRPISALLSVIVFVTVITAFIYFIALQAVNFSEDIPLLRKRLWEMLDNIQQWTSQQFHLNHNQQTDYINKSATDMVSTVANSLSNIFLSFTSLLVQSIFMFFYVFFILYYRNMLLQFVLHLFEQKHRKQVLEAIMECRAMINNYIQGIIIELFIVGVVSCTVLGIMGIKYALLLGVIAAVLNIIPYMGIYTAIGLTMMVTFANSGGSQALWAGVAMSIIHFIDANILMPRIVGTRVKMNAFITITAVLVGNYVWGIAGMFLFIPITGILKIVGERVPGMKTWAILIGTDEEHPKTKKPSPEKEEKK